MTAPSTARSRGERPLFSARSSNATPRGLPGVAMASLMRFAFPPNQEHPEALGRLELFARYGPTDEEGQLRGGIAGSHCHTDIEIRHMIEYNTREGFFSVIKRPRNQVKVLVDTVLHLALEENITRSEIQKLLLNVPKDANDRMTFVVLQDTVLANQRNRLQAIMKSKRGSQKESGPKVEFQNTQAEARLAITRKKKMSVAEENYAQDKRLHAYSTALAELEDCRDTSKAAQINCNVMLCRHRGDIDDRWDRYCAVRRTGRSGYVKARNQPRPCFGLNHPLSQDDGLSNRHPGVSSLSATMS